MKLGYVILYVQDVPATVDFYEKAFGLQRRFLHESNTYAEMETGATALAFAVEALAKEHGLTVRPNRAKEDAAAMEVALVTPDVQAAFERAVKAGAHAAANPKQKPWGQTVAYVRDLNGVLVELCTPITT
ncbi:VOC family protein [Pyxidicoccus fallax]|uniref:VOC family protein n=1 Tax=Pyxidicoccus fallax TaxID=394095 RepID=A0A848LIT5_9BACT|nr:VOC family protein [Pyxidicoccus fallax]NMO17645.1 VOC family protein [Pyxidicoccus fallax]NPC79565.1 VOC family protein [Pyxidicoccus fallax]